MFQWVRQHVLSNFGIKVISLALAITLYLHVFVSQEREIVLEVPLELQAVPENLTSSGTVPEVAKVRFRGLGMDLVRLRTQQPGARLLVEVGDVPPTHYQRPLVTEDVFVPTEVVVQVIEVVSPHEISLEFDRRLVRQLGIVPTLTGRPAPGYITYGRVVTQPESVMVQGPQRRLQSFEFLRTEPVDLTGRDDVLIQQASLRVPTECVASPANVTVRVAIEKVISRTFTHLPLNVLRSGDVTLKRLTPETGSVVVSGPLSLVESLTPDDLRLSIDVLGLPPATYMRMASVELSRTLDAGAVSVEPVEPERFEVELE